MKFIGNLSKTMLLGLIWVYRLFISPILPITCRHLPTCSQYGTESINLHGPMIGLYLTFKRVFRCHPWGTSGYDPVPLKTTTKLNKKIR